MKKLSGLMLLAIVATMGISLSSFVSSGEENNQQQYDGTCPNGKVIKVCGVNGSGCTPSGEC